MKKTKILIPALSIASVGAVVAPIATSCNGTKGLISFDVIKDRQWNTSYNPMTPLNAVEYEDEQAYVDACVNQINNNPRAWADGMISSYIDYIEWYTPSNPHVTTGSVTNRNIAVSNASAHNKTITMTSTSDPIVTSMVSFDLIVKDKLAVRDETTEKVTYYDETVSYQIKNLPYAFYQTKSVTPITTETQVEYKTTVAVPSMLYLFKDTSDANALLAFIESDFSIKFSDKMTDSNNKVLDDLDVTISDVVTLQLLFRASEKEANAKVSSYFVPLLYPVQPNYLSKLTHK